MSSINLKTPDLTELKPRIMVFGVGGAGCNAVNNMIEAGLAGCDFVVANTDAQSLNLSKAERVVQMGIAVTEGLGAGSQPDVGRAAAEEVIDEIADHLSGSHMVFITAGMGGGTGTGSAPVVARVARDQGILTVGVVTRPFQFEGARRARIADAGIEELAQHVDTLIVIPNQNLFRIANAQTTFADAFAMADQVLYSGVACITDLMVKEGLINLDFADVRSVMRNMGKAMMGTGEASGEGRAMQAAEAAISNPLLDETSMKGARGLLVSVVGGKDLTLFEVDEATTRIREEVDDDANIIFGATFDDSLEGVIRVSVVATGIDQDPADIGHEPRDSRVVSFADRAAKRETPAAGTAAASAADPSEAAIAAVAAGLEDFEAQLEPVEQAEVYDDEELIAAAEQEEALRDFVDEEPVEERPTAREARPARSQPEPRAYDYHDGDERRPMGLLRRIASGLSRRDEDEEEGYEVEPRASRRRAAAPQGRLPAPQEERRRLPAPKADDAYMDDVADEAPQPRRARPKPEAAQRRQRQEAEPASRARPAQRPLDDDQLEIPAFLRRQAN
ncbi:cell division protein FtsZ [Acuticoccus mangrovi]|uniref:Cell division protein FtsZ n=1 Tax=Acuticoccus mangrovi TaxID=2796142 RepID=A0A934IE63_9HYPH|nr:cell division protein FtsZ [Acuticoccus mangrovi]MBJ3774934.1 cell division protein FtsZ [Acuticoccus mangrovi]